MKKISNKGFTLVELAIVLVIVGLLVGMGATLIGPLTKRTKYNESENVVKEVYNAVTGYALANKKFPADLTSIGVRTKDGYAQDLLYYPAGNVTASNSAPRREPILRLMTSALHGQMSFVVFSRGDNRCNQTGTASGEAGEEPFKRFKLLKRLEPFLTNDPLTPAPERSPSPQCQHARSGRSLLCRLKMSSSSVCR